MRAIACVLLLGATLGACEESSGRRRAPPPAYPPGGYPPGAYPPGGYPPGAYPPGAYPNGVPPGQPLGQQPPPGTPASSGYDPINSSDVTWLRARAQTLKGELTVALGAAAQQRVAQVPLAFDDTPGEVNAFAACVNGDAVMVVSDGLLAIEAQLAQAQATDELFGSRKVDEYIGFVAQNMVQGAPVPQPPPGFFNPAQAVDPRKLARQGEVFDEQIGFVLGHEMSHHHLGHLGCTGGSGAVGPGDVLRAVSGSVGLFNQPNELAADVAGTNNLLAAGARRQGYRLTEAGGLLTMRFFAGLDQLTPGQLLDFERTHPPPSLRVPVIQQAAATWRFTGGIGIQIPAF